MDDTIWRKLSLKLKYSCKFWSSSVPFPWRKDGEDSFSLLIFLASVRFSCRKIGMAGRTVIKKGEQSVAEPLSAIFSCYTPTAEKSREEGVIKAT